MDIFFYCAKYKSPEKSNYQHGQIALAEGLAELGNNIYSNINYWKKEDEWLFEKSKNVNPKKCDIVVYNSKLSNENISKVVESDQNIKVLIDQLDGFGLRHEKRTKKFDVVLRSHMSKWTKYPENYYPWPFGLTNRIINYTKKVDLEAKNNTALKNYRVGHEIRSIAEIDVEKHIKKFVDIKKEIDNFDKKPSNKKDLKLWKLTGRRHYPNYYKRMGKSISTLAFGGFFLPPEILMGSKVMSKVSRKILNKVYSHVHLSNVYPERVGQWDSFRLWESWASGSVPIHLNFEKYGFLLPSSPSNLEHYIGINLNKPYKYGKIFSDTKKMKKIARRGREWARENYSPTAQAKRFLEIVQTI